MKLRCKDGDIAIISWDYPDCLDNLGRLVEVRSPLDIKDGVAYWRIRPISPELYSLHEMDNSLVREWVTWASRVEHQDSWMIPVGTEGETFSLEVAANLTRAGSVAMTEVQAESFEDTGVDTCRPADPDDTA